MADWIVVKSQPVAHTVSVDGRGVFVGGTGFRVEGMGVTVGVDVAVGGIGVRVNVGVAPGGTGVSLGVTTTSF
jgi:hypothetical protein